ncbi:hypothetical protein MW887_004609 [Aspergillus wentii]|nr:hypothetical protein MW887_004609 [Aspergillus wentii]
MATIGTHTMTVATVAQVTQMKAMKVKTRSHEENSNSRTDDFEDKHDEFCRSRSGYDGTILHWDQIEWLDHTRMVFAHLPVFDDPDPEDPSMISCPGYAPEAGDVFLELAPEGTNELIHSGQGYLVHDACLDILRIAQKRTVSRKRPLSIREFSFEMSSRVRDFEEPVIRWGDDGNYGGTGRFQDQEWDPRPGFEIKNRHRIWLNCQRILGAIERRFAQTRKESGRVRTQMKNLAKYRLAPISRETSIVPEVFSDVYFIPSVDRPEELHIITAHFGIGGCIIGIEFALYGEESSRLFGNRSTSTESVMINPNTVITGFLISQGPFQPDKEKYSSIYGLGIFTQDSPKEPKHRLGKWTDLDLVQVIRAIDGMQVVGITERQIASIQAHYCSESLAATGPKEFSGFTIIFTDGSKEVAGAENSQQDHHECSNHTIDFQTDEQERIKMMNLLFGSDESQNYTSKLHAVQFRTSLGRMLTLGHIEVFDWVEKCGYEYGTCLFKA